MCPCKGMEVAAGAGAGAREGMSIEEEYASTLRRRSNARFFFSLKKRQSEEAMEEATAINEAQIQHEQDHLVFPDDTALRLRGVVRQSASAEIELAMAGYFDASAEASEMCRQLLGSIKSIRSNYQSMDSFLASISDSNGAADGGGGAAPRALNPFFHARSNPFSAATRSNFRQIHDRYSSILQSIKSSHGKVARKLRVAKAVKKISKMCLLVTCGAAAAVAIGVAAHLLFFSLLVGPAVMVLCPIALKRKARRKNKKLERSRTRSLLRLQEQLDTAAKGTYVLGRDLDTVSHLVARLSDGIERENAIARCCVEMVGERLFPVQEVAEELRRSCSSSRRLAEELEEHVCLCLATIHRARVLVIQEISKQT